MRFFWIFEFVFKRGRGEQVVQERLSHSSVGNQNHSVFPCPSDVDVFRDTIGRLSDCLLHPRQSANTGSSLITPLVAASNYASLSHLWYTYT